MDIDLDDFFKDKLNFNKVEYEFIGAFIEQVERADTLIQVAIFFIGSENFKEFIKSIDEIQDESLKKQLFKSKYENVILDISAIQSTVTDEVYNIRFTNELGVNKDDIFHDYTSLQKKLIEQMPLSLFQHLKVQENSSAIKYIIEAFLHAELSTMAYIDGFGDKAFFHYSMKYFSLGKAFNELTKDIEYNYLTNDWFPKILTKGLALSNPKEAVANRKKQIILPLLSKIWDLDNQHILVVPLMLKILNENLPIIITLRQLKDWLKNSSFEIPHEIEAKKNANIQNNSQILEQFENFKEKIKIELAEDFASVSDELLKMKDEATYEIKLSE